jgi:hypothetical protein
MEPASVGDAVNDPDGVGGPAEGDPAGGMEVGGETGVGGLGSRLDESWS